MYIEIIRDSEDNIVDFKRIPPIEDADLYGVIPGPRTLSSGTQRLNRAQITKSGSVLGAFEVFEKEHAKQIVSDIKLLLRFLAALKS